MTTAGVVALVVVALAFALALAVANGRHRLRVQVDREIGALLAGASPAVGPANLARRRDALPEPVRRHLRYAIPEGSPALRTARLRHGGTFRTSAKARWLPIRGEQYFTVGSPGFIWNATVRMAPGLWIEARDCVLQERGGMLVRLFSTFTLVDARGPEMDQGAVMRWLTETIWFPYALVGDRIAWEPVDERSARATVGYEGPPVSLVFTLDDEGRFGAVRGERCYSGARGMLPWKGRLRDYREFSGFRVPASVEVTWELEAGDFSYARFEITRLEYDAEGRF